MTEHAQTNWELIQGASVGDEDAASEFAEQYSPIVRSYFFARWRSSNFIREVDDATQEVFLRCFREGGVLDKAVEGLQGGFRAFLYGVVRNVALKVEERAIRPTRMPLPSTLEFGEVAESESSLAKVFDRAWAMLVMKKAASLQAERARTTGDEAQRRVELLRLRFQEGMPIRDIARLWEADADQLHREYSRARKEFEVALMDVMAGESSANQKELEQQLAELLLLLQ